MDLIRITLLATLAAFFLSHQAPAAEPANPRAHYAGMNVWFLNDWDGSNAFADIMVHARPWQKANWSSGNAIIDPEGWPLEDASTVIFGKDNELGTYKLIAEGQIGNITMMWTPGTVSNLQYDPSTNTTTADITITNNNTGGLTLRNTRRQPGDPLGTGFRNLRLYRPGHATDGSELFDRRFLALMQPFQVIRFMDWVDANKNGETSWANRWRPGMARRPNYSYQSQTGLTYSIPYEYMIALCNQLNADLWLNIPTWADDDYVTKLAQALKYGTDGTNPYTSPQANPVWPPLNPNLKVYVEYANEVWNSAPGFRCFPWILGIADDIAADPAPHPVKLNTTTGAYDVTDRYTLQARYTAYRSVQISEIFRSVWGDAAINTTIRVALMGQIGGNYFNPRQLPWLDAFYNRFRPESDPFPNPTPRPLNYYLYGAGGSAYYGVNTWSTDPDTYFAPGNYPDDPWAPKVGYDALLAKNYGLFRIAYEGGMGLDLFGNRGNPNATDSEKRALMADPRMKTLVEHTHDVWTANGGHLLVYYVNTSAIDWEFTPSINTTNTPKLNAARSIINDRLRVPVTLGQEIPGTLIARDQSQNFVVGGVFNATSSTGEPTLGGLDAGESIAFATNTRFPGLYRVRVRAGTPSTATLQIHINGQPAGNVTLSGIGQTTMVNSTSLDLTIPEEFSAIRLTTLSGAVHLHSIEFENIDPAIPRITTATLPPAAQGRFYTALPAATGGVTPYSWAITAGALPSGLNLNPATGAISGTPTLTGTANFTLTLTDATSPAPISFSRNLSITVNPPPAIATTTLPPARVGESYSVTLNATGGNPPYLWALSSGALPPGLSLNATTGQITGTPTQVTFSVFSLTASDATSPAATDSRSYMLDVLPPTPPPSGAPAILHFSFDEGSGTAIADTAQAGNNHSTTYSAIAWTTAGKYGNATGTTFTSPAIVPANQEDLNFHPRGDAFTISTWVRVPSTAPAGFRALFDKSSGSTQFRVWTTNSWNSLTAIVGNSSVSLNLPTTLANDQWHLVTLVNYNDSGTWRFRLYFNDGTTFAQGLTGPDAPNTGTFRIGALSGGFNTWNGFLDDFRIYPRALSQQEVALLYNGNLAVNGIPVFGTWITSYPSVPESLRGANDDPDGDGIPNLLEYAFGTDPSSAASASRPSVRVLQSGSVQRLALEFTPADTFGLRYFIEASNDLTNWTDVTEITDRITFGVPYTHLDTADLASTPRRFLRLRVSQQ